MNPASMTRWLICSATNLSSKAPCTLVRVIEHKKTTCGWQSSPSSGNVYPSEAVNLLHPRSTSKHKKSTITLGFMLIVKLQVNAGHTCNWRKCPEGAKLACAITLEGQSLIL